MILNNEELIEISHLLLEIRKGSGIKNIVPYNHEIALVRDCLTIVCDDRGISRLEIYDLTPENPCPIIIHLTDDGIWWDVVRDEIEKIKKEIAYFKGKKEYTPEREKTLQKAEHIVKKYLERRNP